jgi:phosphohistidine phosphatase SixA
MPDTDLLQAQSNLYRRLSANLYETKHPGEYFHLHGSLEATTALNMIGLEGHRPDMTDYHESINLIEGHVKRFTAAELEEMNAEKRQAGVTCMEWEEFRMTDYV